VIYFLRKKGLHKDMFHSVPHLGFRVGQYTNRSRYDGWRTEEFVGSIIRFCAAPLCIVWCDIYGA